MEQIAGPEDKMHPRLFLKKPTVSERLEIKLSSYQDS